MASKHYDHQVEMAKRFVIPLLKKEIELSPKMNVLEVGCAESGLVKAFMNEGIPCQGVELIQGRIDLAKKINKDIKVVQGNITHDSMLSRFSDQFDLIVIRDVIEHIPDQKKAFEIMYNLLKPKGFMYITFPPLYSPYAGHQQNSPGFFKKILWVHLLPNNLIKYLGSKSGMKKEGTDEVILNSKIGLSISRFEKIYRGTGFNAIKKELFLSRPVYNVRWNWPVIRFPNIPIFRELFATGCEYILQKS